MRKLYIAFGLLLIFLVAWLTDWNIRQDASQKDEGGSLIQTRTDDTLELELGFPGGKGPAQPLPEVPEEIKTLADSPRPAPEPVSGRKTVSDRNNPETAGNQTHRLPYTYYEVQSGDTLSEIAQKMLGTTTRAKEIMQLNGISDPKRLQKGTRLKIPRP